MKFIKGHTYYYYSDSVGTLEYIFSHRTGKYYYFKTINGSSGEFNEDKFDLSLLFESKDFAMIHHYKNQIAQISKFINNHIEQLNKYQQSKAEAQKELNKFKDKYPEEFI